MTQIVTPATVVAFGPEMPGFGSWDWVGADTAAALNGEFATCTFREHFPDCDAMVFVKLRPAADVFRSLSQRAAIIYAPVDFYGSVAEIDADFSILKLCDALVVHCERLRKYFSTYCRVEYIDHHLKYHASLRQSFQSSGPILWIGVRSNLPPLVEWANRHQLPEELWILTNHAGDPAQLRSENYGFNGLNVVRMDQWSAERHREWTELSRAAIDIKGNDFRSRHKPPTKAMDFLASGIPLAMNRDSSAVEHLQSLGFQLCNPDDLDRWLSQDYWQETITFGKMMRSTLSYENIAARWKGVLHSVLRHRSQNIR